MKRGLVTLAGIWLMVGLFAPAFAQSSTHRIVKGRRHVKMVAYDAKDRRYYSVAWAKAHGMHDKGGDKLVLIPFSKLPKDAKMSRAMHGKL